MTNAHIKCPLVSVVVPIYKVERYLDACVQSVVDQTYTNLEILLVDDGSPDSCPAMCDAWAAKDDRIKALHKQNGGLADARNYGIDRATGDYIYCLDSDDWIANDLIETTVDKAVATDSDMVVFVYRWTNEDGTQTRISQDAQRFPSEGRRTSDEALKLLWGNEVQNFAWSFLARKEVYDGVRYPTGMLMEDVGTTYRLFGNAAHVYFLPRELYFYRIRPNSILSSMSPAVCKAAVYFTSQVDSYVNQYHPKLKVPETDWCIRYLCNAILWAHDCKSRWDHDDYRQFTKMARLMLKERRNDTSFKGISKTTLIKSWAVRTHTHILLHAITKNMHKSSTR